MTRDPPLAYGPCLPERFFAMIPLPYAATGTLIAATSFGSWVLLYQLGGGSVDVEGAPWAWVPLDRWAWLAAILSVLLAYTASAHAFLKPGAERDLREIRRVFPIQDPAAVRAPAPGAAVDPRRAAFAGFLLMPVGLLMVALSTSGPADYVLLEARWALVVSLLLFWLMGHEIYRSLGILRGFVELQPAVESIDLFDPWGLSLFARPGLRVGLYWLVGFGFACLLFTQLELGAPTVILNAVGMAGALAALLWPLRQLRARILAAKADELERVRTEIRRTRGSVLDMGAADSAGAAVRLPALLAYETRVEAVRAWPIDTGARARFAFYLLIPIGSWLGGALVERVLGVLLD